MRDRSRYVLPERVPGEVFIRLESGEWQPCDKRELLTEEWLGRPKPECCCVCDGHLPYRAECLDGNVQNCTRGNIAWVVDRDHERNCLRQLMRRPSATPWGWPMRPRASMHRSVVAQDAAVRSTKQSGVISLAVQAGMPRRCPTDFR